MKTFFFAILASAAFGISTSQAVTYTLSGPLDVFQATTNPENVGNGTGSILGDYDDTTMALNYTITWQDLTSDVSNMHFHVGEPGTAGGVDLPIPAPWSSPQTGNGIILDAGQETNLLAGDWYVNVHTMDFPAGEIRGQVNVTPIPEPASAFLAAAAWLAFVSLSRRRR